MLYFCTHHQATYKGRPAHAKQLYCSSGCRDRQKPKTTWERATWSLRLSSSNCKQNRCSLFEGLEVMSYQRRGVSSGWKYSSLLPSSIKKNPYIIRQASQWKLASGCSKSMKGKQEGHPEKQRLRDTIRKAFHPLVFLSCTRGSQGWRAELGAVTWCSRS